MSDQTTARIDGVRTVGIPVNDQDPALVFYVETLGFEKLMDFRDPDGKVLYVSERPGPGS